MVMHIGYSEIVLRPCFTKRGACIRILSPSIRIVLHDRRINNAVRHTTTKQIESDQSCFR